MNPTFVLHSIAGCVALVLQKKNQQVNKVKESERTSFITESALRLSVLSTSGLTVPVCCDAQQPHVYAKAGAKKFQNKSYKAVERSK